MFLNTLCFTVFRAPAPVGRCVLIATPTPPSNRSLIARRQIIQIACAGWTHWVPMGWFLSRSRKHTDAITMQFVSRSPLPLPLCQHCRKVIMLGVNVWYLHLYTYTQNPQKIRTHTHTHIPVALVQLYFMLCSPGSPACMCYVC